jgi:hypothetical protein
MLSLHDLDDFMDTDAVPAEPAETAAKRQEPSTAVEHNDDAQRNDDALKDVLNLPKAADLLSAQDAYLKGVQSLLSALSAARTKDET